MAESSLPPGLREQAAADRERYEQQAAEAEQEDVSQVLHKLREAHDILDSIDNRVLDGAENTVLRSVVAEAGVLHGKIENRWSGGE